MTIATASAFKRTFSFCYCSDCCARGDVRQLFFIEFSCQRECPALRVGRSIQDSFPSLWRSPRRQQATEKEDEAARERESLAESIEKNPRRRRRCCCASHTEDERRSIRRPCMSPQLSQQTIHLPPMSSFARKSIIRRPMFSILQLPTLFLEIKIENLVGYATIFTLPPSAQSKESKFCAVIEFFASHL